MDRESPVAMTRRDAYLVDTSTSARMSAVRRAGTTPELRARELVAAFGVRYTLNNRDLPGSPDLANRRRRWAIFVHGCFWHRHPRCPRASSPRRNASLWSAKFRRNLRRDRDALRELRAIGYRVLILWECELPDSRTSRRIRSFFLR
jgi:DNA mismatch endonuclease, patch repair protein